MFRLPLVAALSLACATTTPAPPRPPPSTTPPAQRFTRSGDAWVDATTKLAWSDPLPGTYARDEAKRACETTGGALPSVEQFLVVEAAGLMALAPQTWSGFWFWTSTPSPPAFAGMLARAYQGPPLGYVVNLSIDDRISARCVRR